MGEITVSEQIINLGGAVTLNGSNTLLCAGITTAGGEIIISSPISLGANATLDTTGGGSVLNGASITVSGAISNGGSTGHDLTLNGGLLGDITLQCVVGQSAALGAVNLTGDGNVPSATPIVLVLTSYEPENWIIDNTLGAKIIKVITSGYYAQRVTGIDANIPIESH